MRMMTVGAAVILCASSAAAQRGNHEPRVRPMRPQTQTDAHPRRQALENSFRQRSEQIVRQKLNLNDDQLTRLRAVNANIGGQRNALVQQERAVRSNLRDEMAKGGSADQNRVAQLMAQARDLQAKRFALQQMEQQQLSGFLTPVQVAQYVGLQAQMRQRMREMQRGQSGNPEPDL
jgi:Spy/CpxP family protein refolding chaperone